MIGISNSQSDTLELSEIGANRAGSGQQTFSWDHQLWQLVTLKPLNYRPYIYSIERSKPFTKV